MNTKKPTKKKTTKKTVSPRKTVIEKDELIDAVERLFVMGNTRPYQLMRALPILKDLETTNKYIATVKARLRRRHELIRRDVQFNEQVQTYAQAIVEMWAVYEDAEKPFDQTQALRGLAALMKQQADLLGLEPPKTLNLGTATGETLMQILSKLDNEKARNIIETLTQASREQPDKPNGK